MTTPYPKGRPNMQHVADAAGVSKSAVSLALKNDPRLPEATRQRIQQVARDLGYRQNPMMASLMTQLRASRSPLLQAAIAWIECESEPFSDEPEAPCVYHAGAIARAREMGFALDSLRIAPQTLDSEALKATFEEKKIQGAILYIPSTLQPFPEPLRAVLSELACVLVGPYSPCVMLPRAMTDAYQTTHEAAQHALALGYQRPGLVIQADLDKLQHGRFTAGFSHNVTLGAQAVYAYRSPDQSTFLDWFTHFSPDVILTDCSDVLTWVESRRHSPTQHIGCIHLDLQPSLTWAGMQQNHDQVGSNAVDLVVAQLYRAEKGTHENAKTVLTASTWVMGDTVRFHPADGTHEVTN